MKKLIFSCIIGLLTVVATAQTEDKFQKPNTLQQKIDAQKTKGTAFPSVRLFYEQSASKNSNSYGSYHSLQLDEFLLQETYKAGHPNFTLIVPGSDGIDMEVEMTQVELFDNNFKAEYVDRDGSHTFSPPANLYYRGVIKGRRSIATLTVTEDGIRGLFCDETGNYNLGPAGESRTDYVFYKDSELNLPRHFKCSTKDGDSKPLETGTDSRSQQNSANCVRLHVDTDYQLYLHFNSSIIQTWNYVMGLFNEMGAVYDLENINLAISSLKMWFVNDPFPPDFIPGTGSVPADAEVAFENYANYIQDENPYEISCLLSRDNGNLGGITRGVGTLCTSYQANEGNPYGPYLYCDVFGEFEEFPTYSWDIAVWAHELGHCLGSEHTHWCGWPGGAIDNCATQEGNCQPGPSPTNGGTIMSYCHLNDTIILLNGFGPLPGNVIRQKVSEATCLTACNTYCTYALSITTNIGDAGNEWLHFEAYNSVEGFGVVYSGSNVQFDAGTMVLLRPGFNAQAGSVFSAYIDGCGENYSPAPTDDRSKPETLTVASPVQTNLSISPNPFTTSTAIAYRLIEPENVDIRIFNATGLLVATPVQPQRQEAGDYSFTFTAGDLPAGVYTLVMQAGSARIHKRLVLAH